MSKILKTKHPLMQNNFTKDDFDKINVFLKKKTNFNPIKESRRI